MRISDWSSDVCSSDLIRQIAGIAGSESLDRNAKRNACQGIVESWQKAVVRGGRQSQPLRWKGNLRLRLSRDFMLLCELFQLDPKEILFFFASRLSLPRSWPLAFSPFFFDSIPSFSFFLAFSFFLCSSLFLTPVSLPLLLSLLLLFFFLFF